MTAASRLRGREVTPEMAAAALAAALRGLGDEAPHEEEVARFETGARHGTASEPPLKIEDRAHGAAQALAVAHDPDLLPHHLPEARHRRSRRLRIDRARLPDRRDALRGRSRQRP